MKKLKILIITLITLNACWANAASISIQPFEVKIKPHQDLDLDASSIKGTLMCSAVTGWFDQFTEFYESSFSLNSQVDVNNDLIVKNTTSASFKYDWGFKYRKKRCFISINIKGRNIKYQKDFNIDLVTGISTKRGDVTKKLLAHLNNSSLSSKVQQTGTSGDGRSTYYDLFFFMSGKNYADKEVDRLNKQYDNPDLIDWFFTSLKNKST